MGPGKENPRDMSTGTAEAQRFFLGWERACLESAVAFLLDRFRERGEVDLGAADAPLVVLPGGRARRALMAMMADACAREGLVLTPPTIVTPGRIGEIMLGAPDRGDARAAPPLVRRLAWIEALRSTREDVVGTLLSRRPGREDLVAWSALASMLEQRHDELAGEMLTFADVPERARHMPDFSDDARWLAASEVQRRFADVLRAWGHVDPALERLESIRRADPVDRRAVVLIGVPELNRATRTILERTSAPVTALVFAPATMATRFDALGCVLPEAWEGEDVALEEEQILVAEGPDDQADAALEAIAALDGAYATDEVVIGVPDRSIVPYLRQRAERYGAIEVRDAGGAPLARTPVYRLLNAIATFLEEGTLETLASLGRHPDIEARIERRIGRPDRRAWWLDELDEYRGDHLQTRVDGRWIECRSNRMGAIRGIYDTLLETLAPLAPDATGDAAPRRPIGAWARPVLDALAHIYAGVERNRFGEDRMIVEACLSVRDAARDLARHAPDAGGKGVRIEATPAQAIRLLLEQVGAEEIPERPHEETVELLGWLELAMDPAPVVVVTGMNEGAVPSTIVADVLLPDRLRGVLGLSDDRRRLARDAFLLSAIVGSSERVRLVVGRQNPDGDPLKPSRLLLRCDPATMITRLARLTGERRDERRRVELVSFLEHGRVSLYRPGPIVALEAPTEMSVTSFRTYLTSPYQFYLRHVVGAKDRDDGSRELDAGAFGNLVHAALESFGRSEARDLLGARRIEDALMDHLSEAARRRFGPSPSAPVAIQIELARFRLREFARRQAEWIDEGWRIIATEWRPADQRAAFDVDGRTMWLKGKIDRIDRNERTGRLAVLDYKTGDRASDPASSHFGRDGWRDLQLPLYRHLAAEFGPMEGAVLGYVTLSRRRGEVGFKPAPWGEAELSSADEMARTVVRRVWGGEFATIGDPWSGSASVAALCGIGLIGEDALDESSPGDGGDA